ncbi:uncharacterized protein VTP21DRAFT_6387 [Calcarisporiella thermophila]|uniref:uncharacterized protein n=1 Tax=Calcarisporiella thermophila TaxID=911321 RepID=UPI00374278C6
MVQNIVLQDFDISPRTGFLPEEPPLQRLPDPYYEPWENVVNELTHLLLAGRLREKVLKLPILDISRLGSEREYQRAFVILSMLGHAYVWGKHELVCEILPASLAIPWVKIADHLNMCPVVCHAAVVLWNWRLIFPEDPINLSNLATLHTYTGSTDESWFYLVTTAIEATGAPALQAIVDAIDAANGEHTEKVINCLQEIREALVRMTETILRMYERCDPYFFYWKLRPYLAGWENMAEAGLPYGLIYEGITWKPHENGKEDGGENNPNGKQEEDEEAFLKRYRRYAGGSAAQSALIHALDIALGVEHYPTGERPNYPNKSPAPNDRYNALNDSTESKVTHGNNFIERMRQYMPGPHRRFLERLRQVSNIRAFVERSDCSKLRAAYNECLQQLRVFRDKHVQMVTLYIVIQSRRGPSISHGGFAIAHGTEAAKQNVAPPLPTSDGLEADEQGKQSKSASQHNFLYPQTVLSTSPPSTQQPPSLARRLSASASIIRGTGGTNVIPFLQQARDETSEAKILD